MLVCAPLREVLSVLPSNSLFDSASSYHNPLIWHGGASLSFEMARATWASASFYKRSWTALGGNTSFVLSPVTISLRYCCRGFISVYSIILNTYPKHVLAYCRDWSRNWQKILLLHRTIIPLSKTSVL